MIYLDNSATSWPKPGSVKEAMVAYFDEVGGNPGRSGHSRSSGVKKVANDLGIMKGAMAGI